MRDALFILLVAAILFGWTAIRYRRQIVAVIRVGRAVKQAAAQANAAKRPSDLPRASSQLQTPLVNCSGCRVWIPQERARRLGSSYYCSERCMTGSRV